MKRLLTLFAILAFGTAFAQAPAGTKLADEANAASTRFTLTAPATISYGAGTSWVAATLQPGAYVCHPSTFGQPGAIVSPRKQCKFTLKDKGVVGTTPETPPVVGMDAATYRATAALMGTDAGIAYRYGPAADASVPKVTITWGQRPTKSNDPMSGRLGWGDMGCVPSAQGGWCGTHSMGTMIAAGGDYSGSFASVGYIPDIPPPASFYPKKYYGLATLHTLSIGHNVYGFKPEIAWMTYDGPTNDGAANDPNMAHYAKTVPLDQKPVAVGRCFGHGSWCTNPLAVFANGWIMGFGGNTAHNYMKVKLADGKVPTAIALTNSGEFALVTVWDTAAVKGQIAVVALADGCQWCSEKKESDWDRNWGQPRRAYHGLPGLGNYVSGKLVGYVDLPDTLKAPTEISATTGRSSNDYGRVRDYWADGVDTPENRAKWLDDDQQGLGIARTGMAVVISKSEKRAAFVDLRPLFDYYRTQYLKQSVAAFDAMIANRGDAPNQWPYAFSVAPAQTPTVVKVVDLPDAPTAVKVGLVAPYRALIATQNGTLRVFDLGTGYMDQKVATTGKPADIVEKFTVAVGKNPTDITYVRERGWNETTALFGPLGEHPERSYWVTSRGERKLSLLSFDAGYTRAKTIKTLTDSRLVDPISADDVATHGTESYVVTVADYGGRAVRSYRYGPIIAWTNSPANGEGWDSCQPPAGCQMLDNQPFEYGGEYVPPGKPFHLTGANIN